MATDRQKFLEIYRTSGNSARATAKALGISERSVYRALERIDNKEPPFSDRMKERVDLNINPWYHGTNDAEKISEKQGEGWHIERYVLKPGDKLPDGVLKGRDNEFNIKIKQGSGKGEEWKSTGYAGDYDSAVNGVAGLAAKYKDFHATEMEVDVFIPDEFYEGNMDEFGGIDEGLEDLFEGYEEDFFEE